MSIQHVAVRDIVANRYRHVERYRISDSKVDALIQSYANSGFWDGSIQARPHPTRADKFEIAFGHHRIEAAKRAKLATVGLVVAARSDADMLRMMADENREEFKGDHLVAIETIAATVEAFDRGEIELEPVDPKTNKAHIYALSPDRASYTCVTVARFLGWTHKDGKGDVEPTRACRLAFEAYHERANIVPALQRLPEDDRTRQATSAVLSAVKSARQAATRGGQSVRQIDEAAHRAATETVNQIRKGAIASKVKDEAAKIGRAAAGVKRTAPEISTFVHARTEGLRKRIVNLVTDIDDLLGELLPYRHDLDSGSRKELLAGLAFGDRQVSGLFAKWIGRFEQHEARDVTPQRKRLHG